MAKPFCSCCVSKVRHLAYEHSVVHAKDVAVRVLRKLRNKDAARMAVRGETSQLFIDCSTSESAIFSRMVQREIANFPDDVLKRM